MKADTRGLLAGVEGGDESALLALSDLMGEDAGARADVLNRLRSLAGRLHGGEATGLGLREVDLGGRLRIVSVDARAGTKISYRMAVHLPDMDEYARGHMRRAGKAKVGHGLVDAVEPTHWYAIRLRFPPPPATRQEAFYYSREYEAEHVVLDVVPLDGGHFEVKE